MKTNIILLLALISAAALYTLWADHRAGTPQAISPRTTQNSANGPALQKAPDFSFTDLEGKDHKLSDFSGKGVVLNFWASWCAPCVIEFPQMLELAQMVGDDVLVLFLSVDDEKEDITRFAARYGQSLPLANVILGWDHDKSISQTLYQTYRLPETYLIDAQGFLTDKIIGADHIWNGPEMRARVEALIKTPQ